MGVCLTVLWISAAAAAAAQLLTLEIVVCALQFTRIWLEVCVILRLCRSHKAIAMSSCCPGRLCGTRNQSCCAVCYQPPAVR